MFVYLGRFLQGYAKRCYHSNTKQTLEVKMKEKTPSVE